MVNIKYAFFQLSRKVFMSLLILIQISVSLILLYISISTKNQIAYSVNKIDSVFRNQSNILVIKPQVKNPFNISVKDYERFDEYLKTNKKFKHIVIKNDNFFLKPFEGVKDFVQTMNTFNKDGMRYSIVHGLYIQYEGLEYFKLKVSKGRGFGKEDFNIKDEKSIPVLLGNKYLKYFKVGDEIETFYNNKRVKAKVIGFLEDDSYAIAGNNPENIIILGNYVIFPYQQLDLSSNTLKEEDKIFYLFNDSFENILVLNGNNHNKSDEIKNEIRAKASEIGIDISVVSVKNQVDEYRDAMNEMRKISTIIFVVIFLFSSVGFISSILYSLNKRIKEFGVHLMAGATIKDIGLRVIYEVLIMMFFSYLVALIYLFCFQSNYINFLSLVESTAVVIILSILLSVVPVIKVISLNINQLIRGNE